ANITNDYLCGYADGYIMMDSKGEYHRAYPYGEERKLINDAFDKLIAKVKEDNVFVQSKNWEHLKNVVVLENEVQMEEFKNQNEYATINESLTEEKDNDFNLSLPEWYLNEYGERIKEFKEITGNLNYENTIKNYIHEALINADVDIKFNDIKVALYGSKIFGDNHDYNHGDIDILVEFNETDNFDLSEDTLFNILNDVEDDEKLYLGNLVADFNPVLASKSGDIEEHLLNAKKYWQEKSGLTQINKTMTDEQRADYLSEKELQIINSRFGSDIEKIASSKLKRAEIVSELRTYGNMHTIFKIYDKIGDTSLNARFSRNNLSESVANSSNVNYMPYVISNIDEILLKAVKIEEHDDIKNTTSIKSVHELLSVLKVRNENIIVKTTIKELNGAIDDSVYSISNFDIIKDGTSGYLPQMNDQAHSLVAGIDVPSTINLSQLIENVNSGAILKYIPNSLLTDKQIEIKESAISEFNLKHNSTLLNADNLKINEDTNHFRNLFDLINEEPVKQEEHKIIPYNIENYEINYELSDGTYFHMHTNEDGYYYSIYGSLGNEIDGGLMEYSMTNENLETLDKVMDRLSDFTGIKELKNKDLKEVSQDFIDNLIEEFYKMDINVDESIAEAEALISDESNANLNNVVEERKNNEMKKNSQAPEIEFKYSTDEINNYINSLARDKIIPIGSGKYSLVIHEDYIESSYEWFEHDISRIELLSKIDDNHYASIDIFDWSRTSNNIKEPTKIEGFENLINNIIKSPDNFSIPNNIFDKLIEEEKDEVRRIQEDEFSKKLYSLDKNAPFSVQYSGGSAKYFLYFDEEGKTLSQVIDYLKKKDGIDYQNLLLEAKEHLQTYSPEASKYINMKSNLDELDSKKVDDKDPGDLIRIYNIWSGSEPKDNKIDPSSLYFKFDKLMQDASTEEWASENRINVIAFFKDLRNKSLSFVDFNKLSSEELKIIGQSDIIKNKITNELTFFNDKRELYKTLATFNSTKYTFNNSLLIHSQCRVKGYNSELTNTFDSWKQSQNTSVSSGSKAMMIIQPKDVVEYYEYDSNNVAKRLPNTHDKTEIAKYENMVNEKKGYKRTNKEFVLLPRIFSVDQTKLSQSDKDKLLMNKNSLATDDVVSKNLTKLSNITKLLPITMSEMTNKSSQEKVWQNLVDIGNHLFTPEKPEGINKVDLEIKSNLFANIICEGLGINSIEASNDNLDISGLSNASLMSQLHSIEQAVKLVGSMMTSDVFAEYQVSQLKNFTSNKQTSKYVGKVK
ncbi:MAG: hypothetical protein IJS58_10030, partial [Bacilli bacterium]|nr:hypothetical protein [Bacilli bacterium]